MNRLRNWMREHPEEGSLSAYFVLLAVVLMGVVGLVVDSSGKYREVEHAQLVAVEGCGDLGGGAEGLTRRADRLVRLLRVLHLAGVLARAIGNELRTV